LKIKRATAGGEESGPDDAASGNHSTNGADRVFYGGHLIDPGLTGATPVAADEGGPAGYGYFVVQLTGKQIAGGGDSHGQGYARLDFDPEHETACFDIRWQGIDGAVTAAHIHAGHRGSNGPVWIDFFNDKHVHGAQNTVYGCVHVNGSHGLSPRNKVQAVIGDPSNFYLNVHSTEFPTGAIRGQLG
jgi:hypothetical protein